MSPTMPKQTRQNITNTQKAALRARHHSKPHLTNLDLKAWFEKTYDQTINQSSVSRILSAEFASLDGSASAGHFSENRRRVERWPELEKALFEWIRRAGGSGVHVSLETVREKGRQYWPSFYPGQEMPSFSNGWLRGFQARGQRNIQNGEVGAGGFYSSEMITIRQTIGLYKPRDIYNCDETSLCWRLVPDKSQQPQKHKARISLLFCCNSDASDRVPLWLVGTSERPRSFASSGINIENLGCFWRNNQTAWMTGAIFKEWLLWFDSRMVGRKVVLLMDNFYAHEAAFREVGLKLQNTLVIIRPQYQPLNQGIIQTWKAYWRRQWILFMMAEYDKGCNPLSTMTLLLAVRWAISTWHLDLKESTIQNCFPRSLFVVHGAQGSDAEETDYEEIVPEISYGIQQLQVSNHIQQAMDINKFLDPADEKVDDSLTDMDEIILSQYAPTSAGTEADTGADVTEEGGGEEEEEEEIGEPLPHIKVHEALEALYKLRLFEEQQANGNTPLIQQLLYHERVLLRKRSMASSDIRSFLGS